MLLEIGKERGSFNAVKRRLRPVQHFLQPKGLKLRWSRELLEEGLYHRHVQRPCRLVPVELVLRAGGRALAPQHPGGEDAIKQRLYQ